MAIGIYKQVELLDPKSEAHLCCWLNASEVNALKPGSLITLKGIPDIKWQVLCIYSTVVKEGSFKRDWKVDI